jgi:hypothetical protein
MQNYTQEDINNAAQVTITRSLIYYRDIVDKPSLESRLRERLKLELAYWEGLELYLAGFVGQPNTNNVPSSTTPSSEIIY